MSAPLQALKKKRLATLLEDLASAYDDLAQALSDVDRRRIKRRISAIEEEFKETEDQLRQMELADSMTAQRPQRIQAHWEEKLPLIDFKRAIRTCSQVLNSFDQQGDAAIFLLQNSLNLGGKWCTQRLKNDLRHSDKTGDLKLYPIEFLLHQRLQPDSFLVNLGEHLGVAPSQTSLQDYAETLIDTLCRALQSGSVVVLELGLVHDRTAQEDFIRWFVQDFWPRLVRRLPAITNRLTRVKLITIIMSNTIMSAPCLDELRCAQRHWSQHKHKLVELPLQKWDRGEIEQWLSLHSGLTKPGISMTEQQIMDIAQAIYDSTEHGMPPTVYSALCDMLERIHQGDYQ